MQMSYWSGQSAKTIDRLVCIGVEGAGGGEYTSKPNPPRVWSVSHHVLGGGVDVDLQQVIPLPLELEMGLFRAPCEYHLQMRTVGVDLSTLVLQSYTYVRGVKY